MFGAVSPDGREPVLPLTLLPLGASVQEGIEEEAVVDTGIDGELTLPRGMIRRLGYPYAGFTRGTLADGSSIRFDYHEGDASCGTVEKNARSSCWPLDGSFPIGADFKRDDGGATNLREATQDCRHPHRIHTIRRSHRRNRAPPTSRAASVGRSSTYKTRMPIADN